MQNENVDFLWDYLKESGRRIVMYGTGDGADKILKVMEHYELKPVCFTASGDFTMKPAFRDYEVLPFDEVERRFPDFIVLVCFGTDKPQVLQSICDIAEEHEVYVPDVPVAGSTLYDSDYIESNREKLDTVRELFADDKSREVFDGWLEYRLSGKLDVLESIATPREELLSLLKFKKDEFFIDAGAFKGDTVDEFLSLVGQKDSVQKTPKFKKIIAIEPDIKNYTALRRKFYAYGKGIFVPLNAAAWNKDEKVSFAVKSGRAGRVGTASLGRTAEVDGVRIDSLVKEDDKVTFIKIDVEGAEAEVLNGAKSVITRCRPKMLVSLYHRAEDMFELPLMIQSLNPRYKFYLRKTRCIPGWEFQLIINN